MSEATVRQSFFILLIFSGMSVFFRNLLHPAGILGTGFALFLPFLVYLAPHVGKKEWIGNLDLNLPFWLFCAQVVLAVSLLLALARELPAWLRPYLPSRSWGLALGAVTLAALLMSAAWIEPRHRVQSDESIFLATAQNLYHQQTAGACDEGYFSPQGLECIKSSHNFKAKGMAFLLTLGMPVFGSDLSWVFHFQLALLALTLPLFFIAVKVWLQDDFIALLATALLAAQPTLLFQFRAASVEPLYVFLSALALLLLKWASDRNTVRHWVLLALVLAFFAQTRQETAFALAGFLFVAIPRLLSAPDNRAPAFFAALSFFSLPVLLTISYYQGYNFQGGEFAAHGHFWEHLRSNWAILTATPMQNGLLGNPFLSSFAWLTLFGAVTLLVLAVLERRAASKNTQSVSWQGVLIFLLLYHLQSYMILENVSGDFSIEINQRYILVMLPTMAFLGALFLRYFLQTVIPLLLGAPQMKKKAAVVFAIAAGTTVLILGNTARHAPSFQANIMYNRNHLTTEEVGILSWLRTQPDKERLFIYGRPWHFIGYAHSALHYNTFMRMTPEQMQSLQDRYPGEVYYIRGLDCWDSRTYHRKAVERRIATVCDQFEDRYNLQLQHQSIITNNYPLTISRLESRRDYSSQNVFMPGALQLFPEQEQIHLSYTLTAPGERPWKILFQMNGVPVMEKHYVQGSYQDTLTKQPVTAGYSIWEISVMDTATRAIIYRNSVQHFSPLNGAMPLQQQQPLEAQQSWGNLQINRSVLGNALTIGGTRYENGIGTHASAHLRYDLQGKYERFSAVVGLDDEEMCSDGIRVRVFADDRQIADSGKLLPGKSHHFDVPLQGARHLRIEADSLENMNCDHVNIALPVLYPARN